MPAKRLGFLASLLSSPLSHSFSPLLTAAATGNLLDLEDSAKSPVTSSTNSPRLDNSMFGPSSSVNNNMVWVSACPGGAMPPPFPLLQVPSRGCCLDETPLGAGSAGLPQ